MYPVNDTNRVASTDGFLNDVRQAIETKNISYPFFDKTQR